MSKPHERRSGLTGSPSMVQQLVDQAQELQEAERSDGRGRAGHGGRLGQDSAGRKKVTVEMSLHRQKEMREMAEAEDCFPADIVNLAIARLYRTWQAGQIDLHPLKIPARTPRVQWRLDENEFFSE